MKKLWSLSLALVGLVAVAPGQQPQRLPVLEVHKSAGGYHLAMDAGALPC
ncbi:MAG: hypothetical protein H5U38_06325 [Calditrichaeota bacterium]|nr:hypothetical protein [Calditrichota bacterium]